MSRLSFRPAELLCGNCPYCRKWTEEWVHFGNEEYVAPLSLSVSKCWAVTTWAARGTLHSPASTGPSRGNWLSNHSIRELEQLQYKDADLGILHAWLDEGLKPEVNQISKHGPAMHFYFLHFESLVRQHGVLYLIACRAPICGHWRKGEQHLIILHRMVLWKGSTRHWSKWSAALWTETTVGYVPASFDCSLPQHSSPWNWIYPKHDDVWERDKLATGCAAPHATERAGHKWLCPATPWEFGDCLLLCLWESWKSFSAAEVRLRSSDSHPTECARWLGVPTKPRGKKLEHLWIGPLVVTKRYNASLYQVAERKKSCMLHHDLLRPYTASLVPNWAQALPWNSLFTQ